MIDRARLLLQGAAWLGLLAWPASVAAQEGGQPAAAPGAVATPPAATQRAAPEPAQAEADADQAADEQALDPSDRTAARRETLTRMRNGEVLHRERLATIRRLRELAEAQGQAERLALLDKLEVKENARYGSSAQLAATELGNTFAYKQSLLRLAAGRLRKNSPEESPGQPRMPPEERKERQAERRAKEAAERAVKTQARQEEAAKKHKADPKKGTAPKDETPPESGGDSTPRSRS